MMIRRPVLLLWCIVLLLVQDLSLVNSFSILSSSSIITSSPQQRRLRYYRQQKQQQQQQQQQQGISSSSDILLFASSSSSSSSDDDNNNDYIRQILEASWNANTMGRVPTNVEEAAKECNIAIQTALERNELKNDNNYNDIFFVNILLPQYDITYDSNIYDEVLPVEFCIALSEEMKEITKTEIIVRDGQALKTIHRILSIREEVDSPFTSLKTKTSKSGNNDSIVTDNENDDYIDTDESSSDNDDDDIDNFRAKLMSSWTSTTEEESTDNDDDDDDRDEIKATNNNPSGNEQQQTQQQSNEKCYRITSLFGYATISSTKNQQQMIQDITSAVTQNALPLPDENTIIILSPITKEEMVAIRLLTAKYKGKKNIILINCKLNPLPKELISGITVYSILPMIARPTTSGNNNNNNNDNNNIQQPKIVILRRYPRDWELYVDINNNGFDLVSSSKATSYTGPDNQWIGTQVQQYLQNIK